jgi:outer membrane protein OmpA-like peptidoglycan-associated protein
MRIASTLQYCSVAALLAASVGTQGCATKKYVRQQVDPVTTRVAGVEQKSGENAKEIESVSNSASRANERAQGAERLATEAGQAASRANDSATQAQQKADSANALAQQGLTKANDVERMVGNVDNYKLVTNENVLFKVNRAILDEQAKSQLDKVASNLSGMKRFVVEVEGFTDKTGPANYNLSLSERRANAVIRYLTVNKQVPLRNIRVLGIGADSPVADNKTRDGRKQNRRVEIKIYAPDLNDSGNVSTARTTPSMN